MVENHKVCVLPWIHFNAMPNGTTRICCTPASLDPKYDLGNLHRDGINKIINSQVSKDVRKAMINGEWHDVCARCKLEEDKGRYSKRQLFNDKFDTQDTWDFVAQTNEDGSISEENFKMKFWDLRLGNVCNFGCRICIDSSNSSFIMLEKKMPKEKAVITMEKNLHVWDELLERHLPVCEEIHFFGGEPMLMKEMWQVLDRLLETGNTGVRLKYNTNMSTLTYQGKHVFDYWRKLNLDCLQMSIDDIEQRAEYQRHGTNWAKVMENITEVVNEYGEMELLVATSIFNTYYIDELVDYFVEKFPTAKKRFMLNLVTFPNYLTPYIMPVELKKLCHDRLDAMVEKYKNDPLVKVKHVEVLKSYMENSITFKGDLLTERNKCIAETQKYDTLRNQSFEQSHPEIAHFFLDEKFTTDASY
jgi:sulfatase maturation enzyme AslB (radical SAM superfamily)